MKSFKRNMIILTVLLFVCAAVYLNWSYNNSSADDGGAGVASTSGKTEEAGKDADKNAAGTDAKDGDAAGADAGLYYEEGDGTSSASASEYFAMTRLSRQQARDEASETLKTVSGDENASQETIDAALDKIAVMASYSVTETELEALIKAKGFDDCVAYISDDGINIMVPSSSDGLSSAAVAKITDVVTSQTDFSADDIKIVEVN